MRAEAHDWAARAGVEASKSKRDDLFVRCLDLPTSSLREARAAVALQLDRLSPLPAEKVITSVVPLGAVSPALMRFAIGIAPSTLLDSCAGEPGESPFFITVPKQVDGGDIQFRFRNPHYFAVRLRWLRTWAAPMLLSVGCTAVLLLGTAKRIEIEATTADKRLEATVRAAERLRSVKAERDKFGSVWATAVEVRQARRVSCALEALASDPQTGVSIASLEASSGVVSIQFSRPLGGPESARMRAQPGLSAAGSGREPGKSNRVQFTHGAC